MTEMLLLGAGASIEAGVPGAYSMTQKIASLFRENWQLQRYSPVISFAIGALLFQQGVRGGNPFDGVNVEELFNAVQLLAEHHTLEGAAFVGSWHAMVEELDKINPPPPRFDRVTQIIYESVTKEIMAALDQNISSSDASNIDRTLESAIKSAAEAATKNRSVNFSTSQSVGGAVIKFLDKQTDRWISRLKSGRPSERDLEHELQQAVRQQETKPGEGRIYQQTNELMIQTLAEIVWIENSDRVTYLNPIVNILPTQPRLVIATLNYDNSIELMSEQLKVLCETGISEWSQSGKFDCIGDGLHLLKMHGSIDWSLHRNFTEVGRPMPRSRITKNVPAQIKTGGYRPAVIFGQRNKLTTEGPFLEMLRAFQRELSQASRLTVVGYSFRDAHINEYISQWLNAGPNHILRIIDPGFEKSTVEYASQLRRYCTPNLDIHSKGAGDALTDIFR
jgi:hypothetical protein